MALPLQFALHASPRSFVTAQRLRRQAVGAPNTEKAAHIDQVGFGFLIVLAPLIVYAVAHWYGRGDPLSRAVLSPIVPIRAPPAPKPKRSHHKRRAF